MKQFAIVAFLASAVFSVNVAFGAKPSPTSTWPQWRGPHRDSLVSASAWPKDLSESRFAKSWSVSDDGLTVTLNLVDNAKFHDGTPLTSEDVAFSVEVIKANHPFKSMFAPVETVETPDAHASSPLTMSALTSP